LPALCWDNRNVVAYLDYSVTVADDVVFWTGLNSFRLVCTTRRFGTRTTNRPHLSEGDVRDCRGRKLDAQF
jgi:hypothetical protein